MKRTTWTYFVVTAMVLSVGISAAGARARHRDEEGHRRHRDRGTTTTNTSTSSTDTTVPVTATTIPTTTTAGPTTTTMPPTTTTTTSGVDVQPAFPIRAAFYYPWFPEAWNQQGFNPFSNYVPIARVLRQLERGDARDPCRRDERRGTRRGDRIMVGARVTDRPARAVALERGVGVGVPVDALLRSRGVR